MTRKFNHEMLNILNLKNRNLKNSFVKCQHSTTLNLVHSLSLSNLLGIHLVPDYGLFT